mmetsp:Transcript_14346/g.22426  ORF Transcript_14346/g.22426 Transcript_14346/m.22426 type:complete len:247 (+) Transcript_14346:32-772(+)
MALLPDYTDSEEEDDDMHVDTNDTPQNSTATESSISSASTKPNTHQSHKDITWQKKRSYTHYNKTCRHDDRGYDVSLDPSSDNYVAQALPAKKRRELINGALPSIGSSMWSNTPYNPVLSKSKRNSNNNDNSQKSKNTAEDDNEFLKYNWNESTKWEWKNAQQTNTETQQANNNADTSTSGGNKAFTFNSDFFRFQSAKGNKSSHKNQSLKFAPRQLKSNRVNTSTEDLENMGWSKQYSKQFSEQL